MSTTPMDGDEPDLPAPLAASLRRIAGEEALETHPSAAALARYDEEPAGLSPRTRQWIGDHLASCTACARALSTVPRLALPSRSLLPRLWPLAAAAGWILAAYLGLGRLGEERAERTPFLSVHSLVLSAPRGGERTTVPADARLLRCQLVLGEDVPLGASLQVRIEDAADRVLLDESRVVQERNERDWPVLTLDREALPHGSLHLSVRTPGGLESVFELEL
jgi:hypothetical protein